MLLRPRKNVVVSSGRVHFPGLVCNNRRGTQCFDFKVRNYCPHEATTSPDELRELPELVYHGCYRDTFGKGPERLTVPGRLTLAQCQARAGETALFGLQHPGRCHIFPFQMGALSAVQRQEQGKMPNKECEAAWGEQGFRLGGLTGVALYTLNHGLESTRGGRWGAAESPRAAHTNNTAAPRANPNPTMSPPVWGGGECLSKTV